MKIGKGTSELIAGHESARSKAVFSAKVWFCLAAVGLLVWWLVGRTAPLLADGYLKLLVVACLGAFIFLYVRSILHYEMHKKLLDNFVDARDSLIQVEKTGTSRGIVAAIEMQQRNASDNPLIVALLNDWEPILRTTIEEKYRRDVAKQVEDEFVQFKQQYRQKIEEMCDEHPLHKASFALKSSITHLQSRRAELVNNWGEAYKNFSWWNKLKYGESPDLKELDKTILGMEQALSDLHKSKASEFEKLKTYYAELVNRAFERVATTKCSVDEYVKQCHSEDALGQNLLQKAFWLAMLSLPVSAWADVSRAGDVYDALRSVHGGFELESNAEIWWDSLLLPAESLVGLSSLAKGAYFEQLVAVDTGGELFEHFNHADTDIVIDGVEYQIKATDSVSYINSVADGIPIISTSEVAELTDGIDMGYSNEELSESIDLALGGTVVDSGDATVDAILTGVGGLGLFATLQGINHAVKMHENGGDGAEAIFEGAGVAIEGTARAAVNTLEMGYNIINSRPSRFIGRQLIKGLAKLDEKLMDPQNKS